MDIYEHKLAVVEVRIPHCCKTNLSSLGEALLFAKIFHIFPAQVMGAKASVIITCIRKFISSYKTLKYYFVLIFIAVTIFLNLTCIKALV